LSKNFEKFPNIKFHKNPSSVVGAELSHAAGRTDGQTWRSE